ncbi:MAG: peptide ABC transporter substrate-binding protein [Spirochaetales bacterium]|nr:peptide ABC transporter substrate-binding protein [Spirochaetales bacterium]
MTDPVCPRRPGHARPGSRVLAGLCSLLLLSATLLGAQAPDPGSGDPGGPQDTQTEEPKELVVVYSPKEVQLDPLHIYTTMESELSTALYEGLLTYHPFSLFPMPGVAEDWEISEDKTVYRFSLREEAVFSNGDPVTARDFRESWLRVLDPEAQAEYSFLFDVIAGARRYRLGLSPAEEVGIRAVSEKLLEVELERPAGHFLKLLCHMSFAPVHSSYRDTDGWSGASTLIGNGPYYLYERQPFELVLKKNRLYWDAGSVGLDGIRVRFMDDPAAISEGFNQGAIHWANNWDTSRLEDRTKIVFNPLFATSYFYLVCLEEAWRDSRVRRALALLVPWDRVRTEEDTLLPTSRLVPPIPNYPDVEGITGSDREEAFDLLAEAGYARGVGLPEVVFKLPGDPESERIAGLMADAWKRELGVTVTVQTYPYDLYLREVKKGDYTVGSVTWIGDYADPLTFLQMWTEGSNLNDARFADPEFDALIDGSVSQEGEARYEQLAKAESILLSTAVVLPISHTPAFNLVDLDRIEGWFPNVLNIHPFKYVRFRELRVPPGVASAGSRESGAR